MIRLFIALELPKMVLVELGRYQQQLRQNAAHPVKWVTPDACHLTLQFLGEVNDHRVVAIKDGLLQTIESFPPHFAQAKLRLASIGAFPNIHNPNIIWVGVTGDMATLREMQRMVTNAMETQGFVPDQRDFIAHLTLGRVRREATTAQRAELGRAIATRAQEQPKAITWSIGIPILFQSTLTPSGSLYRKLTRNMQDGAR